MRAPRAMLRKLRSREPLDLPVQGYRHVKPLVAVLGGVAVLFLIAPFGASLAAGLTDEGGLDRAGAIAVAAGVGTLLLVLLLFGIRGKTGWNR